MQNITRNKKYYKHDKLQHRVCVSKACSEAASFYLNKDIENFKENFEKCYSKKFEAEYQLEGSLVSFKCLQKNHEYPVNLYDITVA